MHAIYLSSGICLVWAFGALGTSCSCEEHRTSSLGHLTAPLWCYAASDTFMCVDRFCNVVMPGRAEGMEKHIAQDCQSVQDAAKQVQLHSSKL